MSSLLNIRDRILFIERMGVSTNNDAASVAVCARGEIAYGIFWIKPVCMRIRARAIISQHVISLMHMANTDLPGT